MPFTRGLSSPSVFKHSSDVILSQVPLCTFPWPDRYSRESADSVCYTPARVSLYDRKKKILKKRIRVALPQISKALVLGVSGNVRGRFVPPNTPDWNRVWAPLCSDGVTGCVRMASYLVLVTSRSVASGPNCGVGEKRGRNLVVWVGESGLPSSPARHVLEQLRQIAQPRAFCQCPRAKAFRC